MKTNCFFRHCLTISACLSFAATVPAADVLIVADPELLPIVKGTGGRSLPLLGARNVTIVATSEVASIDEDFDFRLGLAEGKTTLINGRPYLRTWRGMTSSGVLTVNDILQTVGTIRLSYRLVATANQKTLIAGKVELPLIRSVTLGGDTSLQRLREEVLSKAIGSLNRHLELQIAAKAISRRPTVVLEDNRILAKATIRNPIACRLGATLRITSGAIVAKKRIRLEPGETVHLECELVEHIPQLANARMLLGGVKSGLQYELVDLFIHVPDVEE